ncbi:Hypothetical protein R9X50_00024900 [Acrodontium crateriforme]|uniref:Major facilitator superfamily (MFS) profile domain-containing protein n=1 Tax=Acrodontium crateriforme TaxID=150365 RepID=A0AAQ3LX19_9PEZI|nr:Hypothetical protein R9X50_00024900 [Acrodontium crateriforme]
MLGYKAARLKYSDQTGFDSVQRRLNSSSWRRIMSSQPFEQVTIIAACGLLVFTACGLNFSFGVYQEHYETLDDLFQGASFGQISLIGTLASSIMMLGAPLAHMMMRAHGVHATVVTSGVLSAVAGITASFGRTLWHFLVAQGVIQGCAACLAYITAITVTPRVLNSRRGLAMGIVTSGTGLGGVTWAPLLRYLLTKLGFRLTLAFVGLLSAISIVFAATVLNRALESLNNTQARRDDIENANDKSIASSKGVQLFRSTIFLAHTLASALQSAAYFTPLFFMSSVARSVNFSETASANIIALCNLSNFAGKLLVGYTADRLGSLETLATSTALSAFISLGMAYTVDVKIAIETQRKLLLVYSALYGASAGAYVALLPTTLVEQFGLDGFAKVNSVVYLCRGLGSLVGTWVAGSLVLAHLKAKVHESVDFFFSFLFVGISLSVAAALVLWPKIKTNIK